METTADSLQSYPFERDCTRSFSSLYLQAQDPLFCCVQKECEGEECVLEEWLAAPSFIFRNDKDVRYSVFKGESDGYRIDLDSNKALVSINHCIY